MSKIFNLIEEQVNILFRLALEDDQTGQIYYGAWIPGAKYIKPYVLIITTLIFLFLIAFFGVYLWNYGLQPAFPGLVAKLTPADPNQAANPYTQLFITLFALMMIF